MTATIFLPRQTHNALTLLISAAANGNLNTREHANNPTPISTLLVLTFAALNETYGTNSPIPTPDIAHLIRAANAKINDPKLANAAEALIKNLASAHANQRTDETVTSAMLRNHAQARLILAALLATLLATLTDRDHRNGNSTVTVNSTLDRLLIELSPTR